MIIHFLLYSLFICEGKENTHGLNLMYSRAIYITPVVQRSLTMGMTYTDLKVPLCWQSVITGPKYKSE